MRITAIYSTERKSKSTTYNLAQTAINELRKDDEVYEFFLPRDMNHFCRGCFSCFEGHPEKCGGYEQIKPIVDAIDKSELIIFTTPVYAYHVPGQMKAFLDHFAYRWLVHQPNGEMTKKQALVMSTAAGAGMKTTVKDIKNSLDFWGVGHFYKFTKSLWAAHWTELDNSKQNEMKESILKICKKIYKNKDKEPRLKVKMMFYGCRLMHMKMGLNPPDVEHWRKQGWFGKKRPWKS